MRNFESSSSTTPKISVKQMNPLNSQSQFYRPGYNQYHTNHQQKYPPSHIQSQSSVSCDSSYRQLDTQQKNVRQRRRKIFDRKVFKATVIPYQQKQKKIPTQRNNSLNSLNNQKQNHTYQNNQKFNKNNNYNNQDTPYQNYYTMNSIQFQHDRINPSRQNININLRFNNTNNSQYETVRDYRQSDQLASHQGYRSQPSSWHQRDRYYQQQQPTQNQHQQLYQDSAQFNKPSHIRSQQQSMLINPNTNTNTNINMSNNSKNKQKVPPIIQSCPSFAKNQQSNNNNNNQNQYMNNNIINSNNPNHNHNFNNKPQQASQIKQQLNQLSYQIRRIKQQVLEQKQQISTINTKVTKSNKQNHIKEKELLNSLINKHQELVQKQSELNHSLDKIVQVQTQSGQRYEQILKYQLQLQRAKRIQNISMQNQRLYQQIIKQNQSKQKQKQKQKSRSQEIVSGYVYGLGLGHVSASASGYGYGYGSGWKQRQTMTMDVTPLSHPVNMNYFRDQNNQREISALQSPYRIDQYDDCQDYDNTLRDLLSPLEIKPDYQY